MEKLSYANKIDGYYHHPNRVGALGEEIFRATTMKM